MYERFPDLTVGWYYGSGENSFLEGISDITRAVADKLGIPFSEISFIGSSAGGYAALYSASLFPGSLALAHNPQIRLKDWLGKSAFEHITGNTLSGQDALRRNDIRWIAENTRSRFFITVNTLSAVDFDRQVEPWLIELAEPVIYPITQHGSVSFLFHRTSGPKAHHVFPKASHALPLINALTISRQLERDTLDEFIRGYAL